MTLVWRSVVCPGWTHVLPAMMTRDRNQHWIWITENIQWMIKSSFNCKLGWFSAWQQQTGKPGWFQCELLHHPGDSPNALYISLCLYVYMCLCVQRWRTNRKSPSFALAFYPQKLTCKMRLNVIPALQMPMAANPPIIRGRRPSFSMVKHCRRT